MSEIKRRGKNTLKEYIAEGEAVRGRRLIFEGRKVDKVYIISKSRTHRGQRVKLHDGVCWIEEPIKIAKKS